MSFIGDDNEIRNAFRGNNNVYGDSRDSDNIRDSNNKTTVENSYNTDNSKQVGDVTGEKHFSSID